MGKKVDITGRRFGRLVAVSETDELSGSTKKWLCICDCGNEKSISKSSLKSGITKSCGCYQREVVSKNMKKHGMKKTKEYQAYHQMLNRCNNSNAQRYKDYGGRGIKVCDRWSSFEKFYEDMGKAPSKKHSLDRIDTDGDYCPENCKWSTVTEQNRNKRNNVVITFRGETNVLSYFAEKYGVKGNVLWGRIYRCGWTLERALEKGHVD